MSHVFYVEEMDNNLVSYARVTNKNKILSAGNTSKIYIKYWPEIARTATYLKNKTIMKTYENKTPIEILLRRKLNIK